MAKRKTETKGIYNLASISFINLAYIKTLCDINNVQINFIFKPDSIVLKVSKIDLSTGLLSKSEKHVFKNNELGEKFTTSTLEIIIQNLKSNWYPNNILST
jgi:hypothetical protein